MPDRAEGRPLSTDPFMGTIMLVLTTLLAAVVALAAGMTWERLLHWAGEVLLISGILLAAVGISDVRREWTKLPGWRGRVEQAARWIRTQVPRLLWSAWNRLARWRWLAFLHLRPHVQPVEMSAVLPVRVGGSARLSAEVTRGTPPAEGTAEERLAWLEAHMVQAFTQLDSLTERHEQEIRDRQTATQAEEAARKAEDQGIRKDLANLAGGGLRLQAWGVVCLLAGTVLTAFW